MPREYRHIKQYEEKILGLREKGLSKRAIGEELGLNFEQVKGVLQRKRRREEKQAYGIMPKKKGRPPKDYIISEDTKVAELKYILARKEAKIKRLEMENELMRDFLSLTERK